LKQRNLSISFRQILRELFHQCYCAGLVDQVLYMFVALMMKGSRDILDVANPVTEE